MLNYAGRCALIPRILVVFTEQSRSLLNHLFLWDDPTFPVLSYRLSAILSDAVVQVSQLVLFCRTGTRTAGPEFTASSTVVGYFMVCSVTHRVHLYVLT